MIEEAKVAAEIKKEKKREAKLEAERLAQEKRDKNLESIREKIKSELSMKPLGILRRESSSSNKGRRVSWSDMSGSASLHSMHEFESSSYDNFDESSDEEEGDNELSLPVHHHVSSRNNQFSNVTLSVKPAEEADSFSHMDDQSVATLLW
eukprot:m.93621 g.93621  ORF g.93621 m.93621 type:complete len:150 (-) comp12392_c1_seq2:1721-2170(-)